MEKFPKLLMLLLVATFSLTFTACGGDEDEPKGDDISSTGQINTATVASSEKLTIDVGCYIYYNQPYDQIRVQGGLITYAGDFQNLSSVSTSPALGSDSWRSYSEFYVGGCYIVYSNAGNFIRFKIIDNQYGTYTVKFQTYIPANL